MKTTSYNINRHNFSQQCPDDHPSNLNICNNADEIIEDCLTSIQNPIDNSVDNELIAIWLMNSRNVINQPIEVRKNHRNGDLIQSTILEYNWFKNQLTGFNNIEDADGILKNAVIFPYKLKKLGNATEFTAPIVGLFNRDYLKKEDIKYIEDRKFNYDVHNNQYQLSTIYFNTGISHKFDYSNSSLSAKIILGREDNFIYYEDFESDISPEWLNINHTINLPYAGKGAFHVSSNNTVPFQLNINPINDFPTRYKLTFVYEEFQGSVLSIDVNNVIREQDIDAGSHKIKTVEFLVDTPENLIINLSDIVIDNFILSTETSSVSLINNDVIMGIQSFTDQNGKTTFYEYDNQGRLTAIKNFKKEVESRNIYHSINKSN